MSNGVRIYYHQGKRDEHGHLTVARARAAFNVPVGINVLRSLKPFYRQIAVGTEEGAMVVHYRVAQGAIAVGLHQFEILDTAKHSA